MRAHVDDYPPLRDFLDEVGARCAWKLPLGNAYVEHWNVDGRAMIVVVYPDGYGWEVFTPCQSDKVDETLADARQRLGI